MALRLLIVALVAVSGLVAQSGPTRHDLRLKRDIGVWHLLDLESRVAGEMRRLGDGDEAPKRWSRKRVVRCVDRVTRLDASGSLAERRYLRAETTEDDTVLDPCLSGFTVVFRREGEAVEAAPAGGAKLSPATQAALPSRAASLLAWIPLPEAVAVGEVFPVTLDGLAPFLLGLERRAGSAGGRMTLEEVDAARSRARLVGDLVVSARDGEGPESLRREFSGPCRITLDLEHGGLERLEWSGRLALEGREGAAAVKGTANFSITLRVRRGAAAKKAARAKARFRNRRRGSGAHDLVAAFPSHYVEVGESKLSDVGWSFDSYLQGEADYCRITLWSRRFPNARVKAAAAAKQLATAAKAYSPRRRSGSSKFGKAAVVSWEAEGKYIETAFMAAGDRLVRIALFCPLDQKTAGKKDLKTVLSSLEVAR